MPHSLPSVGSSDTLQVGDKKQHRDALQLMNASRKCELQISTVPVFLPDHFLLILGFELRPTLEPLHQPFLVKGFSR
jgi:hypothetical protein